MKNADSKKMEDCIVHSSWGEASDALSTTWQLCEPNRTAA